MENYKAKRRRGVTLTNSGRKRLQTAILVAEVAENYGNRFTVEQLSLRTKISTKTLSRLWSLDAGVDRSTLQLCFSAFDLELKLEDYTTLSEADKTETHTALLPSLDKQEIYGFQSDAISSVQELPDKYSNLSYPDGPVSLNSPFYIERLSIEKLAYQEITQPGSVIRIRAPREMGKSSLVMRLRAKAQQQEYHIVTLDCQQLDSLCLLDLNHFFRCFCWLVAKELGIDPHLDAYWDEEMGGKLSCFMYFDTYLLKQIQRPLFLVLEQVDRLFEYPEIAQEFFPLLRSWYEQARLDTNWQKLRLVVVYSTEVYVSLDINCSPFNIGLPLRLPEFTQQQVEELAQRHRLDWGSDEATQLMSLVGGHPALMRIGLYYLCQGITLEQLVHEAIANGGIYRYHLWRIWASLQEKPNLMEAYAKVMSAQNISINPIEAYKLDSLGLIRYEGSCIKPRCELYCTYFKKQLSTT